MSRPAVDAAEIAIRYGLGAAPVLSDGPVARGRQGVVWRLETADGRWAVKVEHRPSAEADVAASTALQEAAHAAGLPTPRVVRTTDGQVFATAGETRVRVYEWVDLLPPDPELDPALVGALLAGLHRTAPPADGPVGPWYAEPVGARHWDDLVARLRAAGAPFADRLAELRDELVAVESWLEPPEELRTCHRDLWADNLRPTAGGGACVVDWEDAGPADPSHELGYVLFEFGRSDPGRARALVAAYRDAGGPGRVDRRGHFTMLVAQLNHIAAIAAADWLEPNPRTPDRADATAWLTEVLEEPHSRDVLDALLRAVRD